MEVDAKKLPKTTEEIPEYLFRAGTKSYEVARLIIMEGVTDTDTLRERTKLSEKTIYNVKTTIRKLVEEIKGAKGARDGSKGDSDAPSIPTPSTEPMVPPVLLDLPSHLSLPSSLRIRAFPLANES